MKYWLKCLNRCDCQISLTNPLFLYLTISFCFTTYSKNYELSFWIESSWYNNQIIEFSYKWEVVSWCLAAFLSEAKAAQLPSTTMSSSYWERLWSNGSRSINWSNDSKMFLACVPTRCKRRYWFEPHSSRNSGLVWKLKRWRRHFWRVWKWCGIRMIMFYIFESSFHISRCDFWYSHFSVELDLQGRLDVFFNYTQYFEN